MTIKSQTNEDLTIGRLARAAGVNIETIRYYQRIGLLDEPSKPIQGYRKYPVESTDRIKFIKRAQQLGFSLREIQELIELGDGHCGDVMQRAQDKREKIETQINDLKALHDMLGTLINQCRSGGNQHQCPIVKVLSSPDS